MTTYLKKQLAEIALPSAPRPGLNIKQTFKGVLSELESREKWISRFTYWYVHEAIARRVGLTVHYARDVSLSLLRTFYAEGLVDNRTFLSWLVQQMGICNLAQAGFVARLADEYVEGMLVSRALTRPFLEVCLAKSVEVCPFFHVTVVLHSMLGACRLRAPPPKNFCPIRRTSSET